MRKNLGHIESLARSYTDTAIKTLAGIMMEQTSPPMARIVAAKVLLDRGWGKPKQMHHSEVDDSNHNPITFSKRERCALQQSLPPIGSFGSLADIGTALPNVRFTPKRWGNRPAACG